MGKLIVASLAVAIFCAPLGLVLFVCGALCMIVHNTSKHSPEGNV